MGQAHNKWSPLYKKAIDDFTTSIRLESGSLNANSFYYRGEAKEIAQGERVGCADFVESCDGLKRGAKDMMFLLSRNRIYALQEIFGDGVHNGTSTLYQITQNHY